MPETQPTSPQELRRTTDNNETRSKVCQLTDWGSWHRFGTSVT